MLKNVSSKEETHIRLQIRYTLKANKRYKLPSKAKKNDQSCRYLCVLPSIRYIRYFFILNGFGNTFVFRHQRSFTLYHNATDEFQENNNNTENLMIKSTDCEFSLLLK